MCLFNLNASLAPQKETFDIIPKKVHDVIIEGNTIPTAAILAKIPYKKDMLFKPSKSNTLIKALYDLGYFRTIEIFTNDINEHMIDVIIRVTEKNKVENVTYTGLYYLKPDEIEKKIHISDIKALDPEELSYLEMQIKKLYAEKGYHQAHVHGELIPTEDNRVIIHFTMDEGIKSYVKRVFFKGNNFISSRKLRTMIFTREDWLFGFFDKAGSYQPEALEYDKHVIENFYQSNGFLTARVIDVIVDKNEETQQFNVTFIIEEGDIYKISEVKAYGNEIVTEAQLLTIIPIKPGNLYSREQIRTTLELLRKLWGQFGYIYADIQPKIIPDEATKTVSIEFLSDLGNKVTINRINIIGNKKTRDKVIRRELLLNEGDMLTTPAMDESKRRLELLGYFDQKNGVNWKINKIDEENADLDLILKEIKSGNFFFQVGFGGLDDIASPSESLKVGGGVQDFNFLGTGISYNVNGTYSFQDSTIAASVATPWLFNRPIKAGFDVTHRDTIYDDFKGVNAPPAERVTGFTGNFGYRSPYLYYAVLLCDGGLERIRYKEPIVAVLPPDEQRLRANYQLALNNAFIPGNLAWIGFSGIQDLRNHPQFPTRGHQFIVNTKFGIPHNAPGNFGFVKFDADARYYTPLIDAYNLVLYMHGHLSLIGQINNYNVPYRELYHVGGIATVRGFFFGQIGPQLITHSNDTILASSLGAKKALWLNVELQFPITQDAGLRGVIFYDGGAGWDTPHANLIDPALLRNNHFNYRQSIGLGIRLLYPTPIRIDWGFKLDRNRKRGESESEIHFTALQEF